MEKQQAQMRLLAAGLTAAFGAFNLFVGLAALLGGGSGRLLESWVYLVLALMGLAMVAGGVLGLAGKARNRWRALGYAMLLLSCTVLIAAIFLRGISFSYMLNIGISILYLAVVK